MTVKSIIVLLFMLIFVSCSGEKEIYEVDGVFTFSLQGIDGQQKNFADLRGKGVMLNIWATWCTPCLNEIPDFIKLYDKYKDKNFEIWGVSTDVLGETAVEPVIKDLGINYPILLAKSTEITNILNVPTRGLPVTIFFDKDGRIVEKHIGPADAYLDKETGETVEQWFEKKILNIIPD
ncbi:TlpA disulfide reductase family protein [candidate division KSB1 bacterium]